MSSLRLPPSFANPVSLLGGIVAAVCFGASTILLFVDLFAQASNPYRGMFAYAVFPSLLFLGLFLVAFGAVRRRRRAGPAFPVVDLNLSRQRRVLFWVATSGLLFIFLSGLGAYKAYQFTDSVTFCGTLCHEVMEPEHTAYLSSPHAKVKCVECHVGEGAQWFVKAKLSGLYQVYATLANKYPRPIPTPIENLRPARETCGHCHWPEKFWGAQLSTRVRHSFDVSNTRREIIMLLETGGGGSTHGPSEGIHWHADVRHEVQYMPRDPRRLDIPWVRVTYPDGTAKEYVNSESPPTSEELSRLPRRIMDCMDCHNRPSHAFVSPEAVVDRLLSAGKIDPKVPYIKTIATELLASDYASRADAARGIEDGFLRGFGEKHPAAVAGFQQEIAAAVPVVQEAYRLNFFPEMKASWAGYPNHISHKEFPGCFRCHNETHKDSSGKALGQSCDLCHTFLRRSPDGGSMISVPAEPTTYHPWTTGGRHSTMNCWDCHKGTSSPYGTCGKCHTVDPEAPMAFACITCHPPAHEIAAAEFKSCSRCHATGGSALHLGSGHRDCSECHEAHDWKSEDPDHCTQVCHAELSETHYPAQACTPCHDFRGVTSGFGSAPEPPAPKISAPEPKERGAPAPEAPAED